MLPKTEVQELMTPLTFHCYCMQSQDFAYNASKFYHLLGMEHGTVVAISDLGEALL